MTITKTAWRWTALIGLWTIVGAICWLMAVQIFMILISPDGQWQRPRISHVTITSVDRDSQDSFTDNVKAKQGDKERSLCMLKTETKGIGEGDEIWLLENYFYTSLRPPQFRLTPIRLLVEYPMPLVLLSLFGIWRIRKAQVREDRKPPSQPRTVFKDEFYAKAQRFADKGPSQE